MILFDPDLGTDLDPDPAPRSAARAKPAAARSGSPSARALAGFLRKAQAAVRLRGEVTVLLTSDAAIRRLNRQFRGKNKATDVLSFPTEPIQNLRPAERVAGDLAISLPTARRQAAECGHALAIELKVLILHGLLHLAGYDHESDSGQMERREKTLRAKLTLPLGLIERGGSAEGGGLQPVRKSASKNLALAPEGTARRIRNATSGAKAPPVAGNGMYGLKPVPSSKSTPKRTSGYRSSRRGRASGSGRP